MTQVREDSVIDGRYRVLSRIGSGGMAEVWCAEDMHLGRKVAIKLLYPRFAQDREFVERFRREASAAAGLQHPNVVGVYDRGEFDGTYFIAMEYCEGTTLKDEIRRRAPFPPRRAIAIAKQILAATRFAHKRGVIHRDLKPHNVMLDSDDNAKVMDFGIARHFASDITEVGAVMGTAQYLSPEQAQGKPVSAPSDLYSIGVVLFEMLTGRAPFDGDSAVAIALKQVNEPPPSPRELVPQIPTALEAVVLKALAKDPSLRYADADAFVADLDTVESRLDESDFDTDSTARFTPVVVPTPAAEPAAAEPATAEPAATATATETAVAETPPLEEEPPAGESGSRRWLWVAGGVAGVAVLLLLGYALFHVNKVTVPAVLGQTLDSAKQELDGARFKVDIKRRSDPAPADTVIDQVPAAGTKTDEGSTVTITVSNGPGTVTVPDVVGLTERDAKARIKRAGLRPRVARESSTKVPEDQVIRSDPSADFKIDRGSVVTIFVSTGPKQVIVPDVTGASQPDAISALRGKNLDVVVREKASNEPVDTVVSQTPVAGQKVDEGSSVTIYVSNGKLVEVPDVTGLSQGEAESQLSDASFSVSVSTKDTDNPDEDGVVLSQSPSRGSEHKKGSTVTITVGTFVPPEEGVVP